MVHASTPVCRASNVRRRRYKSSRCGTRFHPSVQGVHHMKRRRYKGSRCGTRFHPSVQGVHHMRRRRYKGSRCGTRFHPCVQGVHHMRRRRDKGSRHGSRFHPSVQGVQHEACAWAENYGFIQKIVALHPQPHWQKLHAHLRGAAQRVHASMDSSAHWAAWTWQFAW